VEPNELISDESSENNNINGEIKISEDENE
jgi:hypothetical protein